MDLAEQLVSTEGGGRSQSRLGLWLTIAIAVGVFAALALLVGPGDIRPTTMPPELASQPDAYLADGTITQFRPDGSLQYRIRVRQATYFDREGRTELTAPDLELHSPDAPPWRVEAASGEVREVVTADGQQEERADLRGGVRLSQESADGRRTELRTNALELYPSRELARGDQPVMIERSIGGLVRAAGFEADLKSGRIKLFSEANRRVSIVVLPNEFQ